MGSTKKRKANKSSEIADAIRSFSDSRRRSDTAVQKLQYLAREEKRRDKEFAISERKSKMEEWEFVSENIRQFRMITAANMELSYNPSEDDDNEVLDGLMKRRRELGKELGIL